MTNGFNINRMRVVVKEGKAENLAISGRLIYCEEANKDFKIETDEGSRAVMSAGRKIRLTEPSKNLNIVNTGTGDLVCVITYGHGDVEDSAVTGELAIKPAQTINPLPPVVLTNGQVYTIPDNDTRKSLTLYADAENQGRVWLAGEKGKGIPLSAGHAHEINYFAGEVKLCGDGTGSQTVYLMEVNR